MSYSPRWFAHLLWLRGLNPAYEPTYFDRYFIAGTDVVP